jgi:hypothetical protein
MKYKEAEDIHDTMSRIRRYINESQKKHSLNEAELPARFSTDAQEDVDNLEGKIEGKGIVKVYPGKSHTMDGLNVVFKCSIVLNNLEYVCIFNVNQPSPSVALSNGQTALGLTTDLVFMLSKVLEFFGEWKAKWSGIINNAGSNNETSV